MINPSGQLLHWVFAHRNWTWQGQLPLLQHMIFFLYSDFFVAEIGPTNRTRGFPSSMKFSKAFTSHNALNTMTKGYVGSHENQYGANSSPCLEAEPTSLSMGIICSPKGQGCRPQGNPWSSSTVHAALICGLRHMAYANCSLCFFFAWGWLPWWWSMAI